MTQTKREPVLDVRYGSKAERLRAIKEEMKELVGEAFRLVRGTSDEARAKSYWYAHIVMALDDDHTYCGSGSHTMQDSADALEEAMR